MSNVDTIGLERQDLLYAFLRKKKLTSKVLSEKTGYCAGTFNRLKRAERISKRLHAILLREGIPAELLPDPI